MQDFLKPPTYCPDAIATDIGWINPKNGELLISVRNLRQRINDAAPIQESPEEPQSLLDKLTTYTIKSNKEDDRSDTQKILDHITTNTNLVNEDDRTDTQKILDNMTEQTKRGRGRPKKT